jgi:hypothetical protein
MGIGHLSRDFNNLTILLTFTLVHGLSAFLLPSVLHNTCTDCLEDIILAVMVFGIKSDFYERVVVFYSNISKLMSPFCRNTVENNTEYENFLCLCGVFSNITLMFC